MATNSPFASAATKVTYVPAGPTVQAFHDDPSFVRCLLGPYGSGKSSACTMELIRRAGEQAKGPDGIRRSRFALIRATYPQLKTTTLRTFEQWVPLAAGRMNGNPPMTFRLQRGDISAEFVFLAMEGEGDADKLTSLELTGGWINEAREIPEVIVKNLKARVGRYPSKAQGGCTWSGVILDSNPPDDTHWIFRTFETDRPEGHRIFKQPSGLSPRAENLTNLHGGQEYYRRMMAGADEDWCRVHVHGEYGRLIDGRAVFSNFRDTVHIASTPLQAVPDLPLLIGVDFGLTPCALIAQQLVDGRWHVLSEVVTDSGISGAVQFAQRLAAYVAQTYPDHTVASVWADPAGVQRSQTDERTAIGLLSENTGWRVRPAPGENDETLRREVCLAAFGRMIDGKPGVLISPACEVFRRACNGQYHYKLSRSGNGLAVDEKPNKNHPFSDVADAFQYLLLGGGEANVIMNKVKRKRSKPYGDSGSDYDLFDPNHGSTGGSKRREMERLAKVGFYDVDFAA